MFLDDILGYKKVEIQTKKENLPLDVLSRKISESSPVRPFKSSLIGESIRLIAEVKKASPSKGLLCPNFNPVHLAKSYEMAGAAGISVLTDEKFFQGCLNYLQMVKEQTMETPVLRKDFIIDPYQLIEARAFGADAALLIVAALSEKELNRLLQETTALGLTALVEVHNQPELDLALEAGAQIIGINNRDLITFQVDLETTYQLMKYIPKEIIVVSESGIKNRSDIEELALAGVNAVLIGESIVTTTDPEKKIRELLGAAS